MIEFKPRIYYRLSMTLMSSLSVGSGSDENTDHDIIVDSEGTPFIPATAIAGVLRHSMSEQSARELFGYEPTDKSGSDEEKRKDRIIIYDARILNDVKNFYITNRDSVALKNKVGKKGAKFDMQAVEPGVVLTAYVELLDEGQAEKLENAFAKVASGELRFGAKTTRGYGRVGLTVRKKNINSFSDYADFAVYDEEKWNKEDSEISILIQEDHPTACSADQVMIKLSLECQGGVSIREYSTDVGRPDYETLSLHDEKGKKNIPVIPGTSWAGAFRERYAAFIGDENRMKNLFGRVYTKEEIENAARNGNTLPAADKSKIIFSETKLEGGCYKISTRNAIDRFSAATKDGALYTERTYYNGKTELLISVPKDLSVEERFSLAAVIADLHNGFLAVGGLTSVGRGLFKVRKVNDDSDTAKLLDADAPNLSEFVKKVFPSE